MLFLMVFLTRRFTGSNYLILLLGGVRKDVQAEKSLYGLK